MIWLRLGLLFGVLAIILGALGAHALKDILDENALESFNTAVRYQTYQAFALLFLGLYSLYFHKSVNLTGVLLTIGTLMFSGSIYALVAFRYLEMPYRFFGPITPLGGLVIIAGWGSWFVQTFRTKVSTK
jgi:uncharacterized membrane protein YgdD (TMEM256/DUF423 family)